MGVIDWIMALLQVAPKDPVKPAQRFKERSSALGDRLRPWLYGLIGAAVVLRLVGYIVLLLAT
jgi:hypothetical protein